MKPANPFVVRGYGGAEYFCDRVKETESLLSSLRNDCDVTLIAPRRYGKTGLIRHAFTMLPPEYTCIYIDIYALKDLASFTRTFAEAVVGTLDTTLESAVRAAGSFFRSCRPTVIPQAEGLPKFSFDVIPSAAETTLKEVFDYLASKERRVVIAIDEFQQVANFPETGTEALLRSYIQFVPHVRFIFAGSHKHMMEQMFASPNRPFYQSTDFLSLHEIPKDAYRAFAESFFTKDGRAFNGQAFDGLYDMFEGITWYVQAVLNRVWARGGGFTDGSDVEGAVQELVDSRQDVYQDLLLSQNEGAQRMLKAIAAEGCVASPTSGEFVVRSGFAAASSASFALNDLRSRDLIYQTVKGWVIYDRLFSRWLA